MTKVYTTAVNGTDTTSELEDTAPAPDMFEVSYKLDMSGYQKMSIQSIVGQTIASIRVNENYPHMLEIVGTDGKVLMQIHSFYIFDSNGVEFSDAAAVDYKSANEHMYELCYEMAEERKNQNIPQDNEGSLHDLYSGPV